MFARAMGSLFFLMFVVLLVSTLWSYGGTLLHGPAARGFVTSVLVVMAGAGIVAGWLQMTRGDGAPNGPLYLAIGCSVVASVAMIVLYR